MRVTWSDEALRDLRAIKDFISNTSEYYAAVVVERLLSAVDRLEHFPESGRIVPELNDANVREVIDGPYRIVYELRPGQTQVLTSSVPHDSSRCRASSMQLSRACKLTFAGADERSMDVSRRLAPPLLFNALAAQLGR